MVVEGIFWFHPLVWWLRARLVEERESACDEEALDSGNARQVYAESILKICESCVEPRLALVSGFTGADLKKRIGRIMTRRLSFRPLLPLILHRHRTSRTIFGATEPDANSALLPVQQVDGVSRLRYIERSRT
jgi:hypothetical protein